MTDALVFGTFDQIPPNLELEQSVTPSSSASTLPPPDTENSMGWIDFGDFNGLSPPTAGAFDPMLVSAPHQSAHHVEEPSEQALLSSLGAFFAPIDTHQAHQHQHHHHQQSHHQAHTTTTPSPLFRMQPTDTRSVKQEQLAAVAAASIAANTAMPTDLSMLIPAPQNHSFLTDDDKWQAVLTRDPAADAAFVYCVTSTRIYCRPTCASRRPLRANTVYADTPAEAETLGYRACRRCLPHCLASASEMRQVLAVEQAKVVIHDCVRDGRPAPSLSVLAQHVGMSKFHLQRTFKRLVGHSPDAHAKALAKAWRGVGRG